MEDLKVVTLQASRASISTRLPSLRIFSFICIYEELNHMLIEFDLHKAEKGKYGHVDVGASRIVQNARENINSNLDFLG